MTNNYKVVDLLLPVLRPKKLIDYTNLKCHLIHLELLLIMNVKLSIITSVATIKMLESLPFPVNLQNLPEYAGVHHEKMDGTGYS